MRRQAALVGFGLLIGASSPAGLVGPARADSRIVTDGSLGPIVELNGTNVEIAESLGRRKGANLFHSFGRLDVAAGQTARFTGASAIRHILARVTGGGESRIDGTLGSDIAAADLWLINPAGIVLGPGAVIDVPGGIHLSTAGSIALADGASFDVDGVSDALLSVSAPTAFGFLGSAAGTIEASQATLAVTSGGDLELAAGSIAVSQSTLGEEAGRVFLRASSGIRLSDTAAGGDVTRALLVQAPAVALSGGALLAGEGGAEGLTIEAADLTLDHGAAIAVGTGDDASQIAPLRIDAGHIVVGTDATILSVAGGSVDGVPIAITADTIEVTGGNVATRSEASGAAGPVTIETGNLRVADRGEISSLTTTDAQAGNIQITADGIDIVNAGLVASATAASGNAGAVVVQAARIVIRGNDTSDQTGFSAQATADATGLAGAVVVRADTIDASHGAVIESSTFGQGGAGTVLVVAKELTLDDGALIGTITAGAQDAGVTVVNAERIVIREGENALPTAISAQAAPGSTGNAGAIVVVASEILLDHAGAVESSGLGAGKAGSIAIRADRVALRDKGGIASTALGTGIAGDVSLQIGRLNSDGGLIVTTGQSNEGGRILINGRERIYLRDSIVTSSGTGENRGASIIIVRAPVIAVNDSRVLALTAGDDPVPVGSGDSFSGAAVLLGGTTIVSIDSAVVGSRASLATGLDSEIGSDLRLAGALFASTDQQLGDSCAAASAKQASTFRRVGRGGLPASPDEMLAATPAETANQQLARASCR